MWNRRFTSADLMLITGLIMLASTSSFAVEPLSPPAARQGQKTAIVITLQPTVDVRSQVIRLEDVATITCADAKLKERLKRLDLEDALPPGDSLKISSQQIQLRLRLAGFDLEKVTIRGNETRITARDGKSNRDSEFIQEAYATAFGDKQASSVATASSSIEEGALQREFINAAKKCVQQRLPWPAESVEIRLAQPLHLDAKQVNSIDGYEFTAEMRTAGPAVGNVHVHVAAKGQGRPGVECNVVLEVRHFDNVVLTTRAIERGHALSAADLYIDRQDVTEMTDYCTTTHGLIGTTTKRAIRALLPIRPNDTEATQRTDNAVVIKRRDAVKMIARTGGVVVSAMGEAQQDGRKGEMIRVRNIESNASVHGRVIGAGEVEISF